MEQKGYSLAAPGTSNNNLWEIWKQCQSTGTHNIRSCTTDLRGAGLTQRWKKLLLLLQLLELLNKIQNVLWQTAVSFNNYCLSNSISSLASKFGNCKWL